MLYLQFSRIQIIVLLLAIFTLLIDTLLYSLIIPIVPGYLDTMGVPSAITGLLFGSYAFTLLITTPFFGVLSDRVGRKLPLTLGLVALALATLLFAFANNVIGFFIARMLQGVAAGATWTVGLALIADVFPAENRGKVMGLALTAIAAGTLLGAPLGGILYQMAGFIIPFLFVTCLIIIDFLLVVILLDKNIGLGKKQSFNQGVIRFIKDKRVIYILVIVLLAEGSLAFLEPTLPVYMENVFNASPIVVGMLFGAATLGYGISSPISGTLSDKRERIPIMIFGLALIGISLPLLILANSLFFLTIAMFIVGASVGVALAPTLPELAAVVDKFGGDSYGLAYAMFNMFFGIAMAIGPVVGGFMIDLYGMQISILIISAILIFFVIYSILKKDMRTGI